MSIFEDIVNSGASGALGNIAGKLGLGGGDAAVAEGGTTTADASAGGLIGQIDSVMSGEGSLTEKASHLLDRDGDGNPLNDIAGMAGKMFSRT